MDYAKPLYDLLRESGGSPDVTGNYSGAPESFFFAPAAGELVALYRMLIYIEDVGAFDSGKYGNGVTLVNGITVNVKNASGLLFTLTPEPIKSNGGWGQVCFDFNVFNYGAGNEYAVGRWTFEKDNGPPGIVLNGDKGQFLEVLANDDLTGLVKHNFSIRGKYLNQTF